MFFAFLTIFIKGSSLSELSISLPSKLELFMWPYMQNYPFYPLVFPSYLVELLTNILHKLCNSNI